MKYHRFSFIFLIGVLGIGTAYARGADTNEWHPNTELLDLITKRHYPSGEDREKSLALDVETFYIALRDKRWQETYELRANAFREDFSEQEYLAIAKQNETTWALINYEILSVSIQNSAPTSGRDMAILICKFTELPGNKDTYSTVFWHKEAGKWKCLSAGPHNLSIFSGTRPPLIDWR
jgi:hypothetical protein